MGVVAAAVGERVGGELRGKNDLVVLLIALPINIGEVRQESETIVVDHTFGIGRRFGVIVSRLGFGGGFGQIHIGQHHLGHSLGYATVLCRLPLIFQVGQCLSQVFKDGRVHLRNGGPGGYLRRG